MRDSATAHEAVLQSGWLSRMPSPFQRSVLERCRTKQFKRGATIYSIGDPPGGMFGLVAGAIGVSVAPREQGPYVAHFATPGSWFGEAAAITGEPRRVGLRAMRDTDVLHLPLHAIQEIVGQDAATWRLFAVLPIVNLDLAIAACDDLMIRDPAKRCIAVLLRLGNRASGRKSSPSDIDLSHDAVAYLANVSRTTLSAVLGELERSGALERSYRRIRLRAPGTMRAMLRD